MKRYEEEARRRASEVGHTLDQEAERAFQLELKVAKGIDAQEITREEGLKQSKSN